MKNVLIVDDEKTFLLSLSDGLTTYAGEFNTLTAENGKKAVEILRTIPVHLVVTDLKMPEMDGYALLAYMSRHHPDIPVVVMTAYGSPQMEERLTSLSVTAYVEKPLDYEDLARRILDELGGDSDGRIQGITLPAFLQLVEMERKTCTLKVMSEESVGYLFFFKGDLVDAVRGDKNGEEAACEIFCWDNAVIEIEPVCKKKKKNIPFTLSHLLMEAFRLKDEKEKRGGENTRDPGGGDFVPGSDEHAVKTHLAKEEVMALESHLQALKEIKGFKAAGIMNFTGEMLAYDSTDPNIDLSLVGATFNDIFRSAHEASKKIGLDACKETVIATPKGVIVMRCSGTEAKSHFHLIGILAQDGNQALMKMQIDKLVPAVMAEIG